MSKRILVCLLLGLSIGLILHKLRQQRIAAHAYQQRYFSSNPISTPIESERE